VLGLFHSHVTFKGKRLGIWLNHMWTTECAEILSRHTASGHMEKIEDLFWNILQENVCANNLIVISIPFGSLHHALKKVEVADVLPAII
jgi:hypothetical protein